MVAVRLALVAARPALVAALLLVLAHPALVAAPLVWAGVLQA